MDALPLWPAVVSPGGLRLWFAKSKETHTAAGKCTARMRGCSMCWRVRAQPCPPAPRNNLCMIPAILYSSFAHSPSPDHTAYAPGNTCTLLLQARRVRVWWAGHGCHCAISSDVVEATWDVDCCCCWSHSSTRGTAAGAQSSISDVGVCLKHTRTTQLGGVIHPATIFGPSCQAVCCCCGTGCLSRQMLLPCQAAIPEPPHA